MKNKGKILNFASVLLITDEKEDIRKLRDYGFKNIASFRSSEEVVANFKEKPQKLEEFLEGFNIIFEHTKRAHLGIAGNKNRFYCHLWNIDRQKSIHVELENESTEKGIQQTYYFDGYKKENLSDKEVLAEIIKRINQKEKCMKDIERKSKLKKKKDLKILLISNTLKEKNIRNINRKLGLNIELIQRSENLLVDVEASNHDIIIAPNLRESILIRNWEKNRNLRLVASYEMFPILSEDERIKLTGLGSLINLNYTFNKNEENEDRIFNKQYKVLGEEQEYYAESMISTLVRLYQLSSLKVEGIDIFDCDLNDAPIYEREYLLEEKKEIERQQIILKPILDYDNLIVTLTDYFYYTYKAYSKVPKKLENYEIENYKNSYYIARIHGGNYLGAVTLLKKSEGENRTLAVALATSKGGLNHAESVGIYRIDYTPTEEEPPIPNERQIVLINLIENQLIAKLMPLIEKAKADCERKQQDSESNPTKRERKRKKKGKR